MKKTLFSRFYLLFALFACLSMAACEACEKISEETFQLSETTDFSIEPTATAGTFSVERTRATAFKTSIEQAGFQTSAVKSLKMISDSIVLKSPAGANFSAVQSMKVYVKLADGNYALVSQKTLTGGALAEVALDMTGLELQPIADQNAITYKYEYTVGVPIPQKISLSAKRKFNVSVRLF